jgi:HSP20 family molecular chaperone IbpA
MAEEKSMDLPKQEVVTKEDSERTRECACYIPRTDIFENDQEIILLADMPGVSFDSLDITLEKNVLTILGTNDIQMPQNFSLEYQEYEPGDYQRTFTLSEEIDREKIEATMKNGVLMLSLPKAGPAKTRKISVKAG